MFPNPEDGINAEVAAIVTSAANIELNHTPALEIGRIKIGEIEALDIRRTASDLSSLLEQLHSLSSIERQLKSLSSRHPKAAGLQVASISAAAEGLTRSANQTRDIINAAIETASIEHPVYTSWGLGVGSIFSLHGCKGEDIGADIRDSIDLRDQSWPVTRVIEDFRDNRERAFETEPNGYYLAISWHSCSYSNFNVYQHSYWLVALPCDQHGIPTRTGKAVDVRVRGQLDLSVVLVGRRDLSRLPHYPKEANSNSWGGVMTSKLSLEDLSD